jgi:hypothetical protein
MRLLNINKNIIVLAIVLLSMIICLTAAIASSKGGNSTDFSQVFSDLMESTAKENKELLVGWNDYLIKVVGHSNADHLKVIEEFTKDYAKALKAIDEKYAKDRKQDKMNYTSKWLDDVTERFGKEFVCNNITAVMMNLIIAFQRTDAKRYDQDANEIISKESILYLAYESYLNHFMDYYNQLSEKDRKKMNAWKVVAEKYLSITNRSHFAFTHYGRHLNNKMEENAMQKKNNELYMYFKKLILPFGSGALQKAIKDKNLFVTKCEMQGLLHPDNN